MNENDTPCDRRSSRIGIDAALYVLPSSPPRKSELDPFFLLFSTGTLISMDAENRFIWRYPCQTD